MSALARWLAIGIVGAMIAFVVSPILGEWSTFGGHDWDMVSSFRHLTVKTIREYRQLPFWNPYACGGYTAWAYVEAGTNVVSPFLPVYLALPLQVALRLEVVGTALFSAVGTWKLAGRFVNGSAARALACVLFVVNGRWAMQAATGHLMHCYYGLVPWALYFLDRASADAPLEASRRWPRDALFAGACIAMTVYSGAIYPFPQSLAILGTYAFLLAVATRRARPLAAYAVALASGLGLAAPKLLPTIAAFARNPRLVESRETMDLGAFVQMLVARDQDLGSHPANVPQWGWHEWGMYVGVAPLLLVLVALAVVRGRRIAVLKQVGVLLVLVAFGSFHAYAPWTLLHELPVFRSQHVPSRWLYPAALVLALVAARLVDDLVSAAKRRAPLVDLALVLVVALVAWDVGGVARKPMSHAFWMKMTPDVAAASGAAFHTESTVPASLHYVVRDWAPPSLPAMMANTGTVECWSVVPMSVFAKDATGHVPGQGAHGRGDPAYRGEAWVDGSEARATIAKWSPNEVTVEVDGAKAGDVLVLNQNYDPGWRADGEHAIEHREAVATRLAGGDRTVVFRYRPRWLAQGLAIFAATLGAIFAWSRRGLRVARPA